MAVEEPAIRRIMQAYIDGWNSDNIEDLVDLFADDAVCEDPVGSEPLHGIDKIRAFFATGHGTTRLALDSQIRTSHANQGAMAFTIHTELDGTAYEIKAVDVMTINDDGRIQDMKAYWGTSDIKPR